jgi:hypothetical protein
MYFTPLPNFKTLPECLNLRVSASATVFVGTPPLKNHYQQSLRLQQEIKSGIMTFRQLLYGCG